MDRGPVCNKKLSIYAKSKRSEYLLLIKEGKGFGLNQSDTDILRCSTKSWMYGCNFAPSGHATIETRGLYVVVIDLSKGCWMSHSIWGVGTNSRSSTLALGSCQLAYFSFYKWDAYSAGGWRGRLYYGLMRQQHSRVRVPPKLLLLSLEDNIVHCLCSFYTLDAVILCHSYTFAKEGFTSICNRQYSRSTGSILSI